jgi:hypothetical protein
VLVDVLDVPFTFWVGTNVIGRDEPTQFDLADHVMHNLMCLHMSNLQRASPFHYGGLLTLYRKLFFLNF